MAEPHKKVKTDSPAETAPTQPDFSSIYDNILNISHNAE